MKISVIIPTLNAASVISALLIAINEQTLKPNEILVVDSESSDETVSVANSYPLTRVIEIKRADFDHGGTRDMALRASIGDVVLFFTQDVVIKDNTYIETIVHATLRDGVACAYGRQIAHEDAPLYEKYTREFNYPSSSSLRSANDINQLGIKAFFLSDVCSSYRRDAYLAVGGFDHPIPTNEDMLISAKFLRAGYQIAYCAEAVVIHSHSYSVCQEFQRNLKIGRTLQEYQKRLDRRNAESEGVRYVKCVLRDMLSARAYAQCIQFLILCFAKVTGAITGKIAYFLSDRTGKYYRGD